MAKEDKDFDELIKQIKQHEGSKKNCKGVHVLYKCPAGKQTIGYGHNLEDLGITEVEAEFILINDINRSYAELLAIFPKFLTYSSRRQQALIDMMFTLGKTKFLKFKNMIKAIKKEEWLEVKKHALNSKWAKQCKDRALDISKTLYEG